MKSENWRGNFNTGFSGKKKNNIVYCLLVYVETKCIFTLAYNKYTPLLNKQTITWKSIWRDKIMSWLKSGTDSTR